MLILKYQNQEPKPAMLHSSSDCGLWHYQPFIDYAQTGIELCYHGDDIDIDKTVPPPFDTVSDKAFSLTVRGFDCPKGSSLLVLPHNTCYLVDGVPEVIPMCWRDWYPFDLTIYFRRQLCQFRKNQPYAQVMVIPRESYIIDKAKVADRKARDQRQKYFIANMDKYATRPGNAYNVICGMDDMGRLPKELQSKNKKLRLI